MGHPITDAVITVPAYFNDSQRCGTGWQVWEEDHGERLIEVEISWVSYVVLPLTFL